MKDTTKGKLYGYEIILKTQLLIINHLNFADAACIICLPPILYGIRSLWWESNITRGNLIITLYINVIVLITSKENGNL